jgi:hypothetical protein
MNGVDKSFQEKQAAPGDRSGQREELQQPLEDRQVKAIAKHKPEVENVRRLVEEAMLNADGGKMMKWKAAAEKYAAGEARVSDLKAKAVDAECKAEAAERKAKAARVVVEAVSGLEKAAASEVMRAACGAAIVARSEANKAKKAAKKAANQAAQLWCT